MKPSLFRVAFLFLATLASLSSLPALRAATLTRPNILFIFSDDHAEHAISAYGSKVNKTPHIDRLASGGARFLNSFVTNSICTPSRATLLTGQYSHLNGVPVFNRFDGSRDNVAKPGVKEFVGTRSDGERDGLAFVVAGLIRVPDHRPAFPNHKQPVTCGIGVSWVGAVEKLAEIGKAVAVGVAGGISTEITEKA